nr:MAG TPA: hypothetical protein [Caudoviricetes sp.]
MQFGRRASSLKRCHRFVIECGVHSVVIVRKI